MMNQPIVKVEHLSKSYNKTKILDDLSFEVYEQEIVGFIGPNGAGKSTTMKCISALIFPDQGVIEIAGFDLKKQRKQALSQLSTMIEAGGLYPDLSGMENLRLMAILRGVSEERVQEIINFIDIGKNIHRKTAYYSMGMKQRLSLGIAILNQPRFLMLDEPTNGLDPMAIMELRNTLLSLCHNQSISILFSSHQLSEVQKLCDRVLFINQGKLINTPSQLLKQNRYLFRLLNSRQAERVLQQSFQKLSYQVLDEQHISILIEKEEQLQAVLVLLLASNIQLLEIERSTVDIESLYSNILGNDS